MSKDTACGQEDFGLVDLLIFLARYKKFIIAFSLAAMMLMLVVMAMRQNEYSATASLLPPQSPQFSSSALATALGVASNGLVMPSGKAAGDFYSDILKSNRIVDEVIASFDLKTVYQTDSQEEAREMLRARTSIVRGKDGFIVITVRDSGRERVTALVSAYIRGLSRVLHRAAVSDAAEQRAVLMRELATAQKNVAAAEKSLREGMERHGMNSAADNAEAIDRTIAVLRAQISEHQINLTADNSFISSQNPKYLYAQHELESLISQLARLSYGSGTGYGAKTEQGGWETTTQLVRNLADARRQFESISVQLDLAQMDLSEQPRTIQVLDAAVMPEFPVKLELVANVLLAGLAAAILAIAACFVAEAMRVMKALRSTSEPANNRSN
jgi:tyrosine-protein kinase Etk/Wzc